MDASIIGPYDLSASLGYPGEFERREVSDAIRRYKLVCEQVRKPAGLHVVPPYAAMVRERMEEGVSFIGFGLDTLFLGEKIKHELKGIARCAVSA